MIYAKLQYFLPLIDHSPSLRQPENVVEMVKEMDDLSGRMNNGIGVETGGREDAVFFYKYRSKS